MAGTKKGDLFECCEEVGLGDFADALLAAGLVRSTDLFELAPCDGGSTILPLASRATSLGVWGAAMSVPSYGARARLRRWKA